MRVVALGAPGAMGRHATRAVVGGGAADELVVADRDGRAAAGFADELRANAPAGTDITPATVDASDERALRSLLDGADAVLATVGPYSRFGAAILARAVAAGCHYVDLCDDPEPTLEMLALGPAAEAAGVTAVVGAGASPGISNLLAVEAIGALDDVHTVITGWGTGGVDDDGDDLGSGASPSAAITHWLEQCSGEVLATVGGQTVSVRPLQPVAVPLVEGSSAKGSVGTWTVGHPEPLTLPRTFPSIVDSCNVMDLPSGLVDVLRSLAAAIDRDETTIAEAGRRLADLVRGRHAGDTARYLRGATRDRLRRKRWLPPIHALAVGTLDGAPTVAAAHLDGSIPGGMGPITGIPASIVLGLVLDGTVETPGVHAPEAVVDADTFFARLGPHLQGRSSSGRCVVVTTAPDPALDPAPARPKESR